MAVTAERVDRSLVLGKSDEELVAQVRAGNDSAFEAIYDRYARGVLAFCAHMLGSRVEAEDALQLTFASAYRALRQRDGHISLRPWLYTIARNRCLSERRARRDAVAVDREVVDWPCFDGPADQAQRREDLREMFEDMQALPAEQRAALVLFELGDHSHAEIAAVLGVRGEKVKALIYQAREGLARGRQARNSSCADVREQLATVRGAIHPRSLIRAHVNRCPGCAAFEREVRSQRTALALLLPVVLTSRLKTFVLGSAVSSGDRIAAVANATSGSTPLLGAIGAGAEGAAAAGVVTTAGAAGAVSAVGTSAGAVGSLATAGSGAYAVGVVAAPTAALATGLTAAGGGAGIFGALGGWGATGIAIKIALGAAAIAGGVVGATAKPGVLHPPTPIISSRNPVPTVAAAGAPANTAVPAVSGPAVLGGTLTASSGVWSGSPTFTYQWEDCDSSGENCSLIPGATSSSYVLASSDVGSTVKVLVSAANSAGSSSTASSPTAVIAGAPANTAVPAVSGSAVLGGTLTASNGVWSGSPAPTFTYQWEDCDSTGGSCSPIPGATASTYVLSSSDVGSTVKVLVSAANSAGSSSAGSSPTSVIAAAPANTGAPAVSGSAVLGGTLTASNGLWSGSPAPAFSYQWEDCDSTGGNCSPIPGATASTYVLANSDVGSTVKVLVSAANSAGSSSTASSPTAVIAGAPTNTAPPTVFGAAVLGGTLTASNGVWAGLPTPIFSYQWEDCDSTGGNCSPIPGATSASYTLARSDIGLTVRVLVSVVFDGDALSAGSLPTPVVADAPANTSPPAVSGSAVLGGTLTASNGEWSGMPAPTFTYQWEDCDSSGANCSPIPGATSSSYVLASSDVGSTVEVLVSAANSAGTSSAGSSPTAVVAPA